MNIYNIATGHYFNIEMNNGRYYVAKGVDTTKDQSYYLWGLKQSTLQRALTPMGNIIKSEAKSHFEDKSESMGICFLKGCHYADYLQMRGIAMNSGNVIDINGATVGRHCGIARYTIGQRRGEGIPEGLRVIDIDATTNSITVGKREDLYK
jgi:tRNA-specific 2-thiouridylase